MDYKIRNIGNYKFSSKDKADRYDHLYKKYLDLPFEFSLQVLSGDDVEKLHELYDIVRQKSYDGMIVDTFANIQDLLNWNYNERLKRIQSNCSIDRFLSTSIGNNKDHLTILFYLPETGLSIQHQQTFLYDCLMIMKANVLKYKENCYKHINFFVITTSIFMLSDCMPNNALIINVNKKESLQKTFGGNIYDLKSLFTSKLSGSISSNVIDNFIEDVVTNKCMDDVDFIGDDLIRGMTREQQEERKSK